MQNSLVTTGVVLHPSIDTENLAIIDDDVLAVGDESFDLGTSEGSFGELSHGELSGWRDFVVELLGMEGSSGTNKGKIYWGLM